MTAPSNDYSVRPNTQTHRQSQELWDVVVAKSILVTSTRTEAEACSIADRLNIDPDALNRGQTRADRVASASKSK
jgi:hypothetical protein